MIYLSHDQDINTCCADASLRPMRTHLVAADGDRTKALSQMQEQVLEQGPRADDTTGKAGGNPW